MSNVECGMANGECRKEIANCGLKDARRKTQDARRKTRNVNVKCGREQVGIRKRSSESKCKARHSRAISPAHLGLQLKTHNSNCAPCSLNLSPSAFRLSLLIPYSSLITSHSLTVPRTSTAGRGGRCGAAGARRASRTRVRNRAAHPGRTGFATTGRRPWASAHWSR